MHHPHFLSISRIARFVSLGFLLLGGFFIFGVTPALAQSSCLPLPSDAVHWWKADANAQDVVGQDHGTLTNGASLVPGVVNDAFSLDGVDDFVAIGQGVPLYDRFTVEAWISVHEVSGTRSPVFYPNAHGGEFMLGINANLTPTLVVKLGNNQWYEAVSSTPLTPDEWHHVAGTFDRDGGLLKIYIDGILKGSLATPAVPLASVDGFPGSLGAYAQNAYGNSQFFHGLIDELTLYRRALTDFEVQSVFQAGEAGKCVPAAPLVEHLSLISDGNWKAASTEEAGWETLSFDDASWELSVSPNPGSCGDPFPDDLADAMWDSLEGRFAYLRKTINIPPDRIILAASLETVSDDDHDLYVNGVLAGGEHSGRAGPYLTTDITAYLQLGENVIALKGDDAFGGCHTVGVKGSITLYAQIQTPGNQAPTLSYSSETGFVIDGINPDKGTADVTPLTFKAVYTDADNDPPAQVAMWIGDGNGLQLRLLEPDTDDSVPAALKDGDFTNGEQYAYTSAFSKGQYQYYFEASDGELEARLPVSGELSFDVGNQPVILIPSITGSRLNKDDGSLEEVWPNVDKMRQLFNGGDAYLNELIMLQSGQPDIFFPVTSTDVIRSEAALGRTFTYFQPLIDSLTSAGYQENADLFVFPYDWRLDINDLAQHLNRAVSSVLAQTGASKVDIVAHSQGGLVGKRYASDTNSEKIDQLILIGVPQLGAPKAFKVLNYGDNFGFAFANIDILDPQRIKIITQNMPAVYQLLPSRAYVDQVGGPYVIDFTTVPGGALNYDETNQFMLGSPDDNRNGTLLSKADQFHQSLDVVSRLNAKTYVVAGCGNEDTIGFFRIYDKGKADIFTTNGDGTVPFASAVGTMETDKRYYVLSHGATFDHSDLVRKQEPIQQIINILNNDFDTPVLNISQSSADCGQAGQVGRYLFSTHSPVELHVYDTQNRHTGPTVDGDIDLAIPSSRYERIGGNSFAFVPPGDTYRLVIDATSAGEFDLKVKTLHSTTTQEFITFVNVPINSASSTAQLVFSGGAGSSALSLDQDGDAIFEATVPPSAILTGAETGDFAPPITSVSIIGTQGLNGSYYDEATVTLTASDDNSGVLDTKYSLDGGTIFIPYTAPFTVNVEGETTIRYYSVDRAGNTERSTTTAFTILHPSFLVVDTSDRLIYQYDLAGALLATLPLNSSNTKPTGIAADSEHLYTVDKNAKAYIYDTAGVLQASFPLRVITDGARGIAVSTSTIYVVDRGGDKIVTYDLNGALTGHFKLHKNNGDPQGSGILNDTLFVVDESDRLIYRYAIPAMTFQNAIPLISANNDPEGVVSDGTRYWVVDEEDKKIYEYSTAGAFIKTIPITSANGDAEGLEVWYGRVGE